MVLIDGRLEPRPISEVVDKQLQGRVVAFDPDTFEVGYHAITGWYEGPPDRIFEVELASGRRVRVTAGHNLFTLDRDGQLAKVRTGAVATRRTDRRPTADPRSSRRGQRDRSRSRWFPSPTTRTSCAKARRSPRHSETAATTLAARLRSAGYPAHRLLPVARPSAHAHRPRARLGRRRSAKTIACDTAARGHPCRCDSTSTPSSPGCSGCTSRRAIGGRISSSCRTPIKLASIAWKRALRQLGLPVYRAPGAITCCSKLASEFLGWLGTGGKAPTKRVPTLRLRMAGSADRGVPRRRHRWRRAPRRGSYLCVDDLRRSRQRHPRAVQSSRVARRDVVAVARSPADLPDLSALATAQAA